MCVALNITVTPLSNYFTLLHQDTRIPVRGTIYGLASVFCFFAVPSIMAGVCLVRALLMCAHHPD